MQVLYYECLVKIIRAQPVRARMLISNVLYNCNASLSIQEVQEKAAQVCTTLSCPHIASPWPELLYASVLSTSGTHVVVEWG